MATRIQVVLDEEERERFRRQAAREGMSLSAWLRQAGRERLETQGGEDVPRTPEDLRVFFAECDRREQGSEPDWHEHRMVIERSIRGGGSET